MINNFAALSAALDHGAEATDLLTQSLIREALKAGKTAFVIGSIKYQIKKLPHCGDCKKYNGLEIVRVQCARNH